MELHFIFNSDRYPLEFERRVQSDKLPRIGEQIVFKDENGEHLFLISNMVWDYDDNRIDYTLE